LLIKRLILIGLVALICFTGTGNLICQEIPANQKIDSLSLSTPPLPEPLVDPKIKVPLVDFKDVKVGDILLAIAKTHGLNFWIDPNITVVGTIYMKNVKLVDALQFIIEQYNLEVVRNGDIVSFYAKQIQSPPPPTFISCKDNLLSIDVKDMDLSDFAKSLTDECSKNVVLEQGTGGKINGHIVGAEFEQGLSAILNANGYSFRKDEGIYTILTNETKEKKVKRAFGIKVENDSISLNVKEVDLRSLIEDIAGKLNLNIFVYGEMTGTVSASCLKIPGDQIFDYLLRGTNYTYTIEDRVYFFGASTLPEVNKASLIRLEHLKADGIAELIPASLSSKVVLQLVKDHNGLMVFGPSGYVKEVASYIKELDQPSPQVLIEALVVDYTVSDHSEYGIKMNNYGFGDTLSHGMDYYPNVDVYNYGDDLNKDIQRIADQLSINNVGKLPSNFFVKLNAMVQKGNANIRSRPQIATLNGHQAKIDVGTTQYYLLKTETTYGVGQQSPSTQVSEKFQTVEASMSLSVTPWANSADEIIVEIHPEFNTPQGSFDSKVPPTINHRILDSTVRLKNGETVVLGGLIQTSDNTTEERLPILGQIPILGWLFRNRIKTKVNSELVIYLTPHIYYGSEAKVDVSKYIK
jgi:type IV pilus assembly protein PilQ